MPTNPDAPPIVGSQKAYEDFLPDALAIAESDIRPFRADASIAYHNIVAGLDAITPLLDRILREGSGLIDMAQDNIDLAAVFTKHDSAIAGKTPVTPAQVVEAATIGTELLKRLKPKGTKSKDAAMDEVEIRDRLWTLLTLRHRELRRVGFWFWMDDVDDHVPALQSRTNSRKKTTPTAG